MQYYWVFLYLPKIVNMKCITIFSIYSLIIAVSCGAPSSITSKSTDTQSSKSTASTSKEMVMTASIAEGKQLYENHCANCHQLYKATDFSKESWSPILISMQQKAHLNDAQMSKIKEYIFDQLQ